MEQKDGEIIMKIKKIVWSMIEILGGLAIGKTLSETQYKKKEILQSEQLEKQFEFYQLLTAWLEIRQKNKKLDEYFIKHKYKNVAIYGMKELGERLFEELNGTEINVLYTIDKNMTDIYKKTKFKTVYPNDEMEKVDVVVVTAIHYFSDIYMELSQYMDAEIISLEDVVYEMI